MTTLSTTPTVQRPKANTRQIVILAAGALSLAASFLPFWKSPHLLVDFTAITYPPPGTNLWHGTTLPLLLVTFGLGVWVAAALAVQQWVRPTGKLAAVTEPSTWRVLLTVQAAAYVVAVFGDAKGIGFWLGLVATAALLIAVAAAGSIAPLAGQDLISAAVHPFEPYWVTVPATRTVHDLADGTSVGEVTSDDWYLVVAEHDGGALTVQLDDGRQVALHDVDGLVRA